MKPKYKIGQWVKLKGVRGKYKIEKVDTTSATEPIYDFSDGGYCEESLIKGVIKKKLIGEV